jgi:hypothetical protein
MAPVAAPAATRAATASPPPNAPVLTNGVAHRGVRADPEPGVREGAVDGRLEAGVPQTAPHAPLADRRPRQRERRRGNGGGARHGAHRDLPAHLQHLEGVEDGVRHRAPEGRAEPLAPPRRDPGGRAVGVRVGGHRADRGGVTRATSPTRREVSCFPSVEVCRLRIISLLRSRTGTRAEASDGGEEYHEYKIHQWVSGLEKAQTGKKTVFDEVK